MTFEKMPLRRLFAAATGGSWGSEPDQGEVVLPCVRGTDFDYEALRVRLDRAPRRGYSRREAAERAAIAGDLIIEKSGGGEHQPVGRVVLHEQLEPVMPTNFAGRLRPAPGVDSRFVCYLLASLYADGRTRSAIKQSTGIQNLDLDSLLSWRVGLPDHGTQRAIVDYLDRQTARIDALIAKKQRMVDLLDQRTQAQFLQHVLGEGQPGNPSSSGFYASTPGGWKETTLRHLGCRVQTGPFGSQLHAEDYIEGGWPVVNPMNIGKQGIEAVATMTIADDKRAELARHILRPGDIVFGRRGEMGRAGLVEDLHAGWLCGTGSLRLRITGDSLRPAYLKLLLSTAPARAYFELASVGSTMDNLNSEIVLAFPCLVPPLDVQDEAVRSVADIQALSRKMCDRVVRQIDLLREHRQALITAAVTGEVEVPGLAA